MYWFQLQRLSHHVIGYAVAEDEDLPVADDFAGGLVLLLGLGESRFLFNLIIIIEIAPTRSQLVVSNGACGYMNIAVFAHTIKSVVVTHGRRGCIAIYVNEFATTSERTASNAGYGVGEGNGGEGGAPSERIVSNACYGLGSAVVGYGCRDDGGS